MRLCEPISPQQSVPQNCGGNSRQMASHPREAGGAAEFPPTGQPASSRAAGSHRCNRIYDSRDQHLSDTDMRDLATYFSADTALLPYSSVDCAVAFEGWLDV